MIEAGLTAVLIKVAGIGLTPKHLGKTLAEMQPTLTKLNSLYGLHVCGEGGEYETLTIDCPLFKSRIVLEEIETVIHSDNDFATVAYLRVKKGALEPKPDIVQGALSIPPLLEDPYIDLEATLKGSHIEFSSPREWTGSFPSQLPPSSHKRGNWVAVSNVHRSVPLGAPAADLPISEEVEECFSILKNELQSHGLLLEHCANINVFISPMSLFAEVNKAYTRFFGTSPPARACVATSLPWPIRVRMDVIAHAEEKASNRQALHVQGLSYWAPANIGPYSQVILASEQLFVSGQIGLTPRDLTLANSFPLQAALTHQHVARVIKAVSETTGSWDGFPQLVLYWMDKAMNPSNVLLESETLTPRVPSLSIVVDSLPKNAQVEKQVLFHTGRCEIIDEEGEAVVETKMPAFSEAKIDCSRGGVIKVEKLVNGDNSFATVICAKGGEFRHIVRFRSNCDGATSRHLWKCGIGVVRNPHYVTLIGEDILYTISWFTGDPEGLAEALDDASDADFLPRYIDKGRVALGPRDHLLFPIGRQQIEISVDIY
ncbi:hypothetical protein CC2G_010422 [Coprinopsis cinerea AmutBmut pab1-1]|nr:hypothetical protein CC2G_010422 [Coprinopsis cinerea AmutBmut pab1-1]KAG2013522.1 hypothetical protein CC2G_010422 [Coprinopsis cinerea AmutBmut pab1-1]